MRFIVNVMRPPARHGTRGQTQGQPTQFMSDVPCEVKPLRGNEVAQARTVYAEATSTVTLYGNPGKLIQEKDYLTGGDLKNRVLSIGYIADPSQHQIGKIELLCGERTGG